MGFAVTRPTWNIRLKKILANKLIEAGRIANALKFHRAGRAHHRSSTAPVLRT
jgi:hypothetical protein